MTFSIRSNIRNYEVFIEETPDFIESLARHPQAVFVIDENVWNIYSKTLLKHIPLEETIIQPIQENRKNLNSVQKLYKQLVEFPAKRNLTLISFGGGILQDISGFAASTIYRGINWIYIPTTLLAQADSCIGSKTSLNYLKYKNLLGTFFPPTQIHIYTPFIGTQDDADFFSGFGEVIKLHLMGGLFHYQQLVKLTTSILKRQPDSLLQVIKQSLQIKLTYMEGDEFDKGRRNLLNFGHDLGHALESTSDFAIPHGQAVIFGMLAANIISYKRGLLDEKLYRDIAENLLLPSLMNRPESNALEAQAIINAMKQDKKRIGDRLALIMMDSQFNFVRVNDLTPEEVVTALTNLEKQLEKF